VRFQVRVRLFGAANALLAYREFQAHEFNLEEQIMTSVGTSAKREFAVHYKTTRVNDLDVFYRDAGPQDAPVILLLHGFPTSSNMFRNLIPRLANSFRVIAPDYPGFGQSSMPDYKSYAYTFENFADIVDKLAEQLSISKYSMYVMDSSTRSRTSTTSSSICCLTVTKSTSG
jgi:hypothetical protein